VERVLNAQARRALLRQIAPEYSNASASQKQQLLEGFVAAIGYMRKYAVELLDYGHLGRLGQENDKGC
jgi:hypothetical protein